MSTSKTTFTSPTQYIAAVDEAKRADLTKLHRFIRAALPDHKPCIVHGMIGYGEFHYRYASGREGDTARVVLASNKTGFSVYVSCIDENGYLAEQAKARLGKASVGKSCIRFKRLEDIELDVLGEVLAKARTAPTLGDMAAAQAKPKKAAATKARKRS
jgi:hypothetical protein